MRFLNRRLKVRGRKKQHFILGLASFILVSFWFFVSGQPEETNGSYPQDEKGCTSIIAGRLATVDGSVITAHSCDGNYRNWLNIVPRKKNPAGSTTTIFSGLMHTETPWDGRNVSWRGEIPEVEETIAFLNTAYPCMNEYQLAIGETTIGGRRQLYNPEGLFVIEELERIMLQRTRTAREAIKLAGELVKTYGYGDNGECLTIADTKEVWHFEIFGAGLGQKGAVWAAVRIPDDHVGISANIPRIGELNLNDPNNFLASENVISLAVEKGWYDPKSGKPFRFWEAYSGRKPFGIREYFIFKTLAPSLKISLEDEALPFSIKPEKKVSVRDILKLYRETYAGTEYDMTKNLMVKDPRSGEMVKSPVANPWMSRDLMLLLNTLKPGVVEYQRPVAIAACAYAHVIQCRGWLPDPVGGVCWFAFDNPGQSARIPIFAGVTELLPSFELCSQHEFRPGSAAWAFRRANRLATVKWGETGPMIASAIKEFEDRAFEELPDIEKRVQQFYKTLPAAEAEQKSKAYLTKYTMDFARAAVQKYWELGNKFWAMFARGF